MSGALDRQIPQIDAVRWAMHLKLNRQPLPISHHFPIPALPTPANAPKLVVQVFNREHR
jgi:hypothetical protein